MFFTTSECKVYPAQVHHSIQQGLWSVVSKKLHIPSLLQLLVLFVFSELLRDINDCHVLGVPVARVHVIEFQKRGLPHCHTDSSAVAVAHSPASDAACQ